MKTLILYIKTLLRSSASRPGQPLNYRLFREVTHTRSGKLLDYSIFGEILPPDQVSRSNTTSLKLFVDIIQHKIFSKTSWGRSPTFLGRRPQIY